MAATAAAAVPLAGYAAGAGSSQSVVLAALRELEERLGDVGLASLAVAAGAAALSAVVLLVAFSHRRLATPVAIAVTVVAALATTGAAFTYQHEARTCCGRPSSPPIRPGSTRRAMGR